MRQLRGHEIQQILQLFENELSMLPKVSRTDKMRLRKKIANTMMPTLNQPNIGAATIIGRIENRLEDVLALFVDPNLFKSKLSRLLCEFLD
jgi:hypothetical protein